MYAADRVGFGPAARPRTGTALLDSSTPASSTSETLSAETSAQPPLQVPLSKANRSTITCVTSDAFTPGRFVLSSSAMRNW